MHQGCVPITSRFVGSVLQELAELGFDEGPFPGLTDSVAGNATAFDQWVAEHWVPAVLRAVSAYEAGERFGVRAEMKRVAAERYSWSATARTMVEVFRHEDES